MQFRESEPPTSAGMRAIVFLTPCITQASRSVSRRRTTSSNCRFGLGKLFARKGDRSRGQKHVAIATSMYREMNTVHWLEQAEVELRQLG